MPIYFDKGRMAQVLENHEKWWQRELDRPLIGGIVTDAHEPDHTASAPFPTQANCLDFSHSPESVIDAVDAQLSRYEFFGDGYPRFDLSFFGPGVLSAFCGARADNTSGNMWFFPFEEDVSRLHVHYDREHPIAQRIRTLMHAGMEKWQGHVIIAMPDLGGIMDVIASLCGTENLLYALTDEPKEVHRLILETEQAWDEAYRDFAAILRPQGMFTDWNGILSRSESYIPQCDFAYMLGPRMFEEFVLPTLRRNTERFSHTIYHLDGVGQLCHLDMLLSLPALDAVQWVYGMGKPGPAHWKDVYRRILDAGKQIMLIDDPLSYCFNSLCRDLACFPFANASIVKKDLLQALTLL